MKDHPVGEADADLADGDRFGSRVALGTDFNEAGGKGALGALTLAGIRAGAMLPGILAELLVVQALVIAELSKGPTVAVILILAQRCCKLTLDRVLLSGGLGCCCCFHLPLGFGLRQRSTMSGNRQCGEVDGYYRKDGL